MEDWLIFQIRPLVEYRQNQRTQNKLIEWRGETRAWLQNQREQKSTSPMDKHVTKCTYAVLISKAYQCCECLGFCVCS